MEIAFGIDRYKMVARYENEEEIVVGGENEEDCMAKLIELTEEYGMITWYSGYFGDEYEAGEYVGEKMLFQEGI